MMIRKLIPKGRFSKNVVTLITGTALAQALPIAITPILTRLYTPEDFGVFAVFMAVSSILAVLVTGRYELAIIVPQKNEDAINIVALSVAFSFIVSFFIFLGVLIFGEQVALALGQEGLENWLYLVPISTLLMGCFQSLNYWNNRCSNYKRMAASRVLQSTSAGAAQLGGGFSKLSYFGLIGGQVIGQFLSLMFLLKSLIKNNQADLGKINKKQIKMVAVRYKNFPQFLILAHGFNAGSSQSPALLLTGLFSAPVAGFYMLTQRVLNAPIGLVANAIRDVFRQEASSQYAKGKECRAIYLSTLKKLALLSFLPFLLLFFVAEHLFAIVFGEEWRVSGEYAAILAPMFFLRFITSPLSSMFMIAEVQKIDLIWQIFLFISVISSLFFGGYYNSIEVALYSFSLIYCLMFLINLYLSYGLACGKYK
jgi:O-antigen/teichoic acid export membrane protein